MTWHHAGCTRGRAELISPSELPFLLSEPTAGVRIQLPRDAVCMTSLCVESSSAAGSSAGLTPLQEASGEAAANNTDCVSYSVHNLCHSLCEGCLVVQLLGGGKQTLAQPRGLYVLRHR